MNPAEHDDLFGENFRTLHDPNNQDMAVQAYFKRAFRYAVSPPHLMTRDDVNSRLKSFSRDDLKATRGSAEAPLAGLR